MHLLTYLQRNAKEIASVSPRLQLAHLQTLCLLFRAGAARALPSEGFRFTKWVVNITTIVFNALMLIGYIAIVHFKGATRYPCTVVRCTMYTTGTLRFQSHAPALQRF